ncbi:MAG: hypothetical protein ACUVX9_10725 [Anaerolineae bacterium]
MTHWYDALNESERAEAERLDSPPAIQAFLDSIPYSDEPIYRCPLQVWRERKGHCFDGAVFAAACLRRLGYPPLVLDMIPNARDDDHVLAVFRVEGSWGAVAKSNFVGLRYREPVYRSLRELIMSYFEPFFNVEREKTLRGYTRPLNLRAYDRLDWEVRPEPMDCIAEHLDRLARVSVLTPAQEARLAPVDERYYQAGLLGANPKGLWRPGTGEDGSHG